MAVVKFSKQFVQPNPIEVDYWVDSKSDPYGAIIKYHNGDDWVPLNNAGNGPIPSFDYYTKEQINTMLAKKANIEDVNSKVDDAEFAELIKNIEIDDVGDDTMQLVIFKYDNTRIAVTIPTATATNPGVLSGSDFVNFVKQYQLQELYTEMYDLFADIRSKYQRKLKAGRNINIDQSTNTISVSREIEITWNDLSIEQQTDLINSLEQELSDAISKVINGANTVVNDANQAVIKANIALNNANNAIESAQFAENSFHEYEKDLKGYQNTINESFREFRSEIREDVNIINNAATDAVNISNQAINTANTAKDAIATLQGLADADLNAVTAANVIIKIEQNATDIQTILNSEEILSAEEYQQLEQSGQIDLNKKYYIYDN